jgi:oligopeptide/dipeptide ABC transporter ATP-binding protein
MVFIAHDLAVVKNVSDRVAVMYLGKLCEVARPDDLYRRPEHPYTEALLTSIPEPDPGAARNGKAMLAGDLPSPINPPSGCRFRTRCPFAQQKCAEEEPQMRAIGPDHFVACHFPLGTNPARTFATAESGPIPVAPEPPSSFDAPSWSVQAPDAVPDATPTQAPAPPPTAVTPPAPSSPAPGERSPLWVDPHR